MQVLARAPAMKLDVQKPPAAQNEGWAIGRMERTVRGERDVGPEKVLVLLDERLEVRRAHLLLALYEEFDIHGKRRSRFPERLHRLDVGEVLRLVVPRAPRKHPAVPDLRLERLRGPTLRRVGGLHVVVAVNKQSRRPRGALHLPIDDRKAFRREDSRLHPRLLHEAGKMLGSLADARSQGAD